MNELKLTKEDWDFVVDGLDALKSREFAGKLMGMMLGSAIEEKMTIEQKLRFKQEKEDKKREKDKEEKVLKEKVDLVKSKILVLRNQGKLK